MAFIDGFDRYLLEEAGMDQGQKRAKHRAEMLAAVRSVGKCAMAITTLAVVLYCTGCVTAPNSNLAINVNLLGSFSRLGQALGGTNTTIKGHSDGGGSLTATAPMSP
jgi:hypothetical protein